MSSYVGEIEKIKNPENIHEALAASSPYVLMKAFESDQTVRHLIEAGREVFPLISEELKKIDVRQSEIVSACLAYILQKIDLRAASEILRPLFAKAIMNPGPFFVHFAAHALRQEAKLPVKPLEIIYTEAELKETLQHAQIGVS